MNDFRRRFVFVLGILVALPGLAAGKGRPLGTIAGLVRDDQGRPIIGALVKVINANQMVRSVRTDPDGQFYARNLTPGQYRLLAEARGFVSSARPIEVKPDVVLSLRFELRRIGTLAEQADEGDAYRWAVRGVPRPVLRLQDEKAQQPSDVASGARVSLTGAHLVRGMVQLVGGVPLRPGTPQRAYTGVNVALAGQVTPNLEVVFAGQMASAEGYPGRFQVIASTAPSDAHHLTASIGYARLRGIDEASVARNVQQLSLGLTDSWQVSGPVIIVYGVDLSRFSGTGIQLVASPRFGVNLAANSRTRLSAQYFSVSAQDVAKQGEFDYEGGQVLFTDPRPVAIVADATQIERNRRFQFEVERQIDEQSRVVAAVFYDNVSGRGVGLLAPPIDAAGEQDATWQMLSQQGQTQGARLMYSRQFATWLTGMVGYALGQGQRLAVVGSDAPITDVLRNGYFQVFSLALNANLTPTRTRISTVYRVGSQGALFAIDPFYGRLDVFDPSLSVVVTQDVPEMGFLPGDWQASLDARNLLDQQTRVSADGQSWLLGQTQRSIRGSVSVRF
jgi:hypothetical protein